VAYFPADIPEIDITQFKGSAQSSDPYALDLAHGLYTQNIDFTVGPGATNIVQAGSRRGTSQVTQLPAPDGGTLSLFAWFFNIAGTQDCYAVYYAPAVGAKAYSQHGATFVVLVAVTGAKYLSFATDGIRGYFAFGDATGRFSSNSGYIYNASSTTEDQLFAQPLSTGVISLTVSSLGTGLVTVGTHRIGILYTTRNGYSGPLSPVSGSGFSYGFSPATLTIGSPPALEINVAVNFASIPSYMTPGGTIQVVMSTAANLNRYYAVPGSITNVPAFPGTVNIPVNITDGDLAATGTDVTEQQNLLASSLSGTPPFNPSAIFNYSSRMAYVTLDMSGFPVIYFSDPSNYQSLTAAYHGIYLEGKQIPVQGCSIGQECFIATLSSLYACADNGGLPTTWTPPSRIDGSVGILAPSCMLSSAGRILLASEKGLFSYHGGAFPSIPLSYWQAPDWNRINWAAPTQVSIVDDGLDRVIRVAAPLKVQVTAVTIIGGTLLINTGVQLGANVIAYPHLFQPGLSITTAGIVGVSGANGTFIIQTVPSPTSFTVTVSASGAYTSGGVVTPNAPNAQMTWNYSIGEDPADVMYSLNGFNAYRMGASATIRNIATGYDESWYSPAASNPGNLIRRVLPSDAIIHQDLDLDDNPIAIPSYYETGIVPGAQDLTATVHDYHGMHLRATGSGLLSIAAYTLDHAASVIPVMNPITLSQNPGMELLIKWWMRGDQESISLSMNLISDYFLLTLMRLYFTDSVPFR
jgi:hypothetical protein